MVEILSPSTRKQDRGTKARRYAELGVEHFWIVDPDRACFECHRLVDGAYRLVVEARRGESAAHPDWPGLMLDLNALLR